MKVYIRMNQMQDELVQFRNKNIDFIHVYFCEARHSRQYRSPNATLDSCCQTVYIVTSSWSHLYEIVHNSVEWCAGVVLSTVMLTQLHYTDKRIVNIMEVYIERNNLPENNTNNVVTFIYKKHRMSTGVSSTVLTTHFEID